MKKMEEWEKEFDKEFKVYRSAFEEFGKVYRTNPHSQKGTIETEIDIPIKDVKAFIRELLAHALAERDKEHYRKIRTIVLDKSGKKFGSEWKIVNKIMRYMASHLSPKESL